MIAPNHGLTGKQLAALNLLAASPNGCTEAAMKANGFGIGLMATLVRAGLAVATPGVVQADGRHHPKALALPLPPLRTGVPCRDALIRSRSTLAGSSFGSCGTNSPRKASARMVWSRWSINLRALTASAARRSIHETANLARLTILACKVIDGSGTGNSLMGLCT